MGREEYPTQKDRFFMEPGTDIPCRIDPYTLLVVADYGSSKDEAVYQCICMRCGALHRIRRIELQAMARQQKKRAKKHGTVWPPFSGHCPACSESDVPKLTGAKFTVQKLNAEGFSVVHWVRQEATNYHAWIGIFDEKGRLTEAQPFLEKPWPVFLEVTAPSSALLSGEEMFCRLLVKLSNGHVTSVNSADGKSVYLHAFCLPSGRRLR